MTHHDPTAVSDPAALPRDSPASPPSPRSPAGRPGNKPTQKFHLDYLIAFLALAAICLHLVFRYLLSYPRIGWMAPLVVALVLGGAPLIYSLARKLGKLEFDSDLLAGISIVTAVLMSEYLVGTIVVLMLSGGRALEQFASRRASSVLDALARRMPQTAHRREGARIVEIPLAEIAVGDCLVVFPHEICPVDGVVTEGQTVMDEAYLTGEPFEISKAPGSNVISGAINGAAALAIRALKLPVDSRYARIMQVMHETEQRRPKIRRLADRLGAYYTPIALGLAVLAWVFSGHAHRFLAVVVVATPCPLLIAIPVAVIGAISLSARRGIIIKNPVILERVDSTQTFIFDKTGTLTYGVPEMTELLPAPGFAANRVLAMAASLERYSKHPLAGAVLRAAEAQGLVFEPVTAINEQPGHGLSGLAASHEVLITGRAQLDAQRERLPAEAGGLECIVLLDGQYAATMRFRDTPRKESELFLSHLKRKHGVRKMMLVSGDRESEVRYLAQSVGIEEIHAQATPEEKVKITAEEAGKSTTLFVGDGINDAPALQAATMGVAFGQTSDIAAEAADAVLLDMSLGKVDELIHIGRRMRRIALQSALGGMALSIVGMGFAAAGYLPPVGGAIAQEIIDLAAVLNAVRVALPQTRLTDF